MAQPTPVTVVNFAGFYLAITAPNPLAVVFCDTSGNEYTVTGSVKGVFDQAPTPVVLCNSNGLPVNPNFTVTSNAHTIVITSTKTGNNLGRPVPIVLTDPNGNAISLGALTFGAETGSPLPVVFCGVTGITITATLS